MFPKKQKNIFRISGKRLAVAVKFWDNHLFKCSENVPVLIVN